MTKSEAISTVDGAWLRDASLVGIRLVISHRDHINYINVFPVADSDTGTNLAFTLDAIRAGAMTRPISHAGQFMALLADHALDGARGNSGAILAQYFLGFSEAIETRSELTVGCYALAACEGSRSAMGAIAEPCEGTMLSVLRDHASALRDQVDKGVDDFRLLLDAGLEQARVSLQNTPMQLEVLRQNGVVDAGGQGFVDLMEGVQHFATTGSMDGLVRDDDRFIGDQALVDSAGDVNDLAHRFCTECMITGADIDRRKLRESLQQLESSSLVIAGTRSKVRVHAHLNNPAKLFVLCESFGNVSSQKADDMHQQQISTHSGQHRVAVITDTGADMPDAEMERLGIHVVPLRVNFADRQYLDKVSLSPHDFYQLLRTAPDYPKTSQPPPGDYRRQFEFLCSHFESVCCLTVSSKLSGTWQAAQSAATRVDAERIWVWDTLNASSGHGLLTQYAAEAAQAGFDVSQVLAALDFMRDRTFTYAAIRDLDYGVRGGRMPAWLNRVSKLLGLIAVVGNNGQGRIVGKGVLLASGETPARFARWIRRRLASDGSYRLMIGHCDCADDARALRDHLISLLPMVHSAFVTAVGSAIGAHGGPGTLVVGVQNYLAPGDWKTAADQIETLEESQHA